MISQFFCNPHFSPWVKYCKDRIGKDLPQSLKLIFINCIKIFAKAKTWIRGGRKLSFSHLTFWAIILIKEVIKTFTSDWFLSKLDLQNGVSHDSDLFNFLGAGPLLIGWSNLEHFKIGQNLFILFKAQSLLAAYKFL